VNNTDTRTKTLFTRKDLHSQSTTRSNGEESQELPASARKISGAFYGRKSSSGKWDESKYLTTKRKILQKFPFSLMTVIYIQALMTDNPVYLISIKGSQLV
jgi:hypothetical protein